MSAYIKLSTLDYPRHAGDIAIDPAGMADYALVNWTDRPSFEPAMQRCSEAAPVQDEAGNWKMVWSVRDLTAEEIQQRKDFDERTRKEREARMSPVQP